MSKHRPSCMRWCLGAEKLLVNCSWLQVNLGVAAFPVPLHRHLGHSQLLSLRALG